MWFSTNSGSLTSNLGSNLSGRARFSKYGQFSIKKRDFMEKKWRALKTDAFIVFSDPKLVENDWNFELLRWKIFELILTQKRVCNSETALASGEPTPPMNSPGPNTPSATLFRSICDRKFSAQKKREGYSLLIFWDFWRFQKSRDKCGFRLIRGRWSQIWGPIWAVELASRDMANFWSKNAI